MCLLERQYGRSYEVGQAAGERNAAHKLTERQALIVKMAILPSCPIPASSIRVDRSALLNSFSRI